MNSSDHFPLNLFPVQPPYVSGELKDLELYLELIQEISPSVAALKQTHFKSRLVGKTESQQLRR